MQVGSRVGIVENGVLSGPAPDCLAPSWTQSTPRLFLAPLSPSAATHAVGEGARSSARVFVQTPPTTMGHGGCRCYLATFAECTHARRLSAPLVKQSVASFARLGSAVEPPSRDFEHVPFPSVGHSCLPCFLPFCSAAVRFYSVPFYF